MSYAPFIGITDFTESEQVTNMWQVLGSAGSKRMLGVGVMMSYETLHSIPNEWDKVFPPKEDIEKIFFLDAWDDGVYNCLHYADYKAKPDLCGSLQKAIKYGGMGLRALQLDMTWPAPEDIANALHISRRHMQVILQVGAKAMEAVDNDPKKVVAKLADYEGVIARVLLDKSMGRGLGMDAKALLPYIEAIDDHFGSTLGIVVAGGLGPSTMRLVEPIVERYPNVSIDAQGRLRPSGNALDPIDWEMAKEYLRQAAAMLG
ncbi:MAG TPA: hypothetical protein VM103_01935 [Candidatus Paceibacterota bacterium]|nr:hypothetical protein [Candidatus Paceibacterota bacterium]